MKLLPLLSKLLKKPTKAEPAPQSTKLVSSPLAAEYLRLWNSMRITGLQTETARVAGGIVQNKARYREVEKATGVPWYVVGIIHHLECGGDFRKHLHNGDPLSARTVQVPRGRPVAGSAPFTWLESACDAMSYDGLAEKRDWGIVQILERLERYNGMGYRNLKDPHVPIHTPYLWSGTNHYTRGKFVADGRYDPHAISRQPGAAALLRALGSYGVLFLKP